MWWIAALRAAHNVGKVLREGYGPPLRTMVNVAAKRVAVTPRAAVGRDALIPPGPAAA